MLEKAFNDVYTKFKLHFYQNVFQRFATREATLTTVESFCMEGIMAMGEPTIAEFSRMMQISTSINTIHGAFSFACLKRSRTLEAPIPTNISTNSDPDIEKNGTFDSPATAFASIVLPVPGGPTRRTPFGIDAPTSVYFFGL